MWPGPRAVAATWRAGARLWAATLAVTGGWIAVYLAVVNQRRWSLDLDMTRDLLWRSVTHGIVPSLAAAGRGPGGLRPRRGRCRVRQ